MKLIKLHIFILVFLSACTTKEKTQQICLNENDTYKIKISSIQTKVDKNGKGQCSKYAYTNQTDSIYESYGHDFLDIIASSLKTNKKYFSISGKDTVSATFLKIKIENFSNKKLNYDSIIKENLIQCFNLEIIPFEKEISGYSLSIIDSAKLKKIEVKCGSSSYSFSNGLYSYTSANLNLISKSFDDFLKDYFIFNTESEKCYSLKIPFDGDINKINKSIEKYGLKFSNSKFNQSFYEIRIN